MNVAYTPHTIPPTHTYTQRPHSWKGQLAFVDMTTQGPISVGNEGFVCEIRRSPLASISKTPAHLLPSPLGAFMEMPCEQLLSAADTLWMNDSPGPGGRCPDCHLPLPTYYKAPSIRLLPPWLYNLINVSFSSISKGPRQTPREFVWPRHFHLNLTPSYRTAESGLITRP